jgi:hypothetical protein
MSSSSNVPPSPRSNPPRLTVERGASIVDLTPEQPAARSFGTYARGRSDVRRRHSNVTVLAAEFGLQRARRLAAGSSQSQSIGAPRPSCLRVAFMRCLPRPRLKLLRHFVVNCAVISTRKIFPRRRRESTKAAAASTVFYRVAQRVRSCASSGCASTGNRGAGIFPR